MRQHIFTVEAFGTELNVDDFNEMLRSSNWVIQTIKKLVDTSKPVKVGIGIGLTFEISSIGADPLVKDSLY